MNKIIKTKKKLVVPRDYGMYATLIDTKTQPYFSQMLSGEKTEEWRDCSDYWVDKISKFGDKIEKFGADCMKIKFQNGMGATPPWLIIECEDVRIYFPNNQKADDDDDDWLQEEDFIEKNPEIGEMTDELYRKLGASFVFFLFDIVSCGNLKPAQLKALERNPNFKNIKIM